MSGAIEVAQRAEEEIEELLADMFEGKHEDNEISLGFLTCMNGEVVQVQLKVTSNQGDFLDGDGPYYDFDCTN